MNDCGTLGLRFLNKSRIDGARISYLHRSSIRFEDVTIGDIQFSNDIHQCDIFLEKVSGNKLAVTYASEVKLALRDIDCSVECRAALPEWKKVFSSVSFSGTFNRNATVSLVGYWIESLAFRNFYNNGTIKINNATLVRNLIIMESNLEGTGFYTLRLSKGCVVSLTNSDISDTVFNNFRWNDSYELDERWIPVDDEPNYTYDYFLGSLRESYRQLKANYIKNNNKIEALAFQRNEFRTHLKILRFEKEERGKIVRKSKEIENLRRKWQKLRRKVVERSRNKASHQALGRFYKLPRILVKKAIQGWLRKNNRISVSVEDLIQKDKILKFRDLVTNGDYLILRTNQIFSDFGQNIWKPLKWLFSVHVILVYLLLISGNLDLEPGIPGNWKELVHVSKYYWKVYWTTILPTHSPTVESFNGNGSNILGFIDFLIRVLSGYFIYYFITASRKYHH